MDGLVELRSRPGVRVRRSAAEKRQIVEQALQPGASVARVAQEHGVNANQVFQWRRALESGKLPKASLIPVLVKEDGNAREPSVPVERRGLIRIELPGGALIRLEGSPDTELVRAILESLRK